MATFQIDRLTQFSESDAAGIIHFSKVACYVEEAEHAFYAQAGYPIELQNAKSLRWPRVNYTANYSKPIFPFQKIRILLKPACVGTSSINWSWAIKDITTNDSLCSGEIKSVCCVMKKGIIAVSPLPDDLKKKLFSS